MAYFSKGEITNGVIGIKNGNEMKSQVSRKVEKEYQMKPKLENHLLLNLLKDYLKEERCKSDRKENQRE